MHRYFAAQKKFNIIHSNSFDLISYDWTWLIICGCLQNRLCTIWAPYVIKLAEVTNQSKQFKNNISD